MNVGDVVVGLSADLTELDAGIKRAQESLQTFGSGIEAIGDALSVGITVPLAAFGAAALGASVNVGHLADELLDLRDQTGLSLATLQEFRHVSVVAGVSTDTLATAAIKLTTALSGSGEESKQLEGALTRIGVSARDATGALRPMDELFPDIIAGLQATADQTTRNALAADIFGRSWAELAPVLSLGADGLEQARQEARDLGLVITDDGIEAADEFRKSWETLKEVLKTSAAEIGVELLPVMQALAAVLTENIIPAFKSAVGVVHDAVGAWNELSPAAQTFLGVSVALAAALGPLLSILGRLVVVIGAISAAIVASPWIAVAVAGFAAIAALGTVIADNWDRVPDSIKAAADEMKRAADAATALRDASGEVDTTQAAIVETVKTTQADLQKRLDALTASLNRVSDTFPALKEIDAGLARLRDVTASDVAFRQQIAAGLVAQAGAAAGGGAASIKPPPIAPATPTGFTGGTGQGKGASKLDLVVGKLGDFAKAIGGILSALNPWQILLEAIQRALGDFLLNLTPIIELLADALKPILKALFPVFKLLAIAATYVGQVFFTVAGGVAEALGGLIKAIGKAVDLLPFVSGKGIIKAGETIVNFGKGAFEAAGDLADARDKIKGLEWKETSDKIGELGDAAERTTASLLNVPDIVKVDRLRFDATRAATIDSGTAAGGNKTTNVTIQNVNIDRVQNFKDLLEKLQNAARQTRAEGGQTFAFQGEDG